MNRETLFLAALMHDIGKFWQRADENGTASSSILSTETKRNIGLYCPQYNSQYSHKHVLWTAEFLDRHKQFFRTVIGEDNFEDFFKASVKHHAPDNNDIHQLIVQKADHYASGVDRTGEAGQKDSEAENAWDSFKNVQMVSIFEGLQQDKDTYTYRLPINSLSLNEDNFPVLEKAGTKGQLNYAQLWKVFEEAFLKLQESNGRGFSASENVSYLLYRYASSVPSSTIHLPDVSLFDHLKSVAIFALCLYDYLESRNKLATPLVIEPNEAPFLLVGGDLSGIQKYIYDIVSTDAARNLKGRSFYLQIMAENAVELILHELGLPWSAVVYASGGGFYLLTPNTDAIIEKLKKIRTILSDQIFSEHQISLSLNIAWQEVTQEQIFQQRINDAWGNLARKIGRLKTQKFKEKIKKDYLYFFNPSEIGGKQIRDFITGEEFTEEEEKPYRNNEFTDKVRLIDDEIGKPVKRGTFRQIELGKILRRTDYWITSKYSIPQWKKYEFRIGDIEVFNYFISEKDLASLSHRHPDNVFIRALDLEKSGFDIQHAFFNGNHCVYGFTFYGGNDFPENEDGKPVTFDQLAMAGPGNQKLGILRMDVDNLGAIFISGLDNRRRTFSRYSVLSRNLDFFFKGYLNKIWRDEFRKNCSIIYSGGDDLFIVGHWMAIIDFAKKIREEFTKLVCQNPNLSISGGVALTGGKFPISKGAQFSEDAEKKAKEHNADGAEKNAITLFGVPLNWESELPIVEELKDKMAQLILNKKLPRGLLQKLLNYAKKARDQKASGQNHSWRWHMAYDFSRAAKRQDEVARPFYELLKNAAFTDIWEGKRIPVQQNADSGNQRTFLDLLEVAARWAEVETKE